MYIGGLLPFLTSSAMLVTVKSGMQIPILHCKWIRRSRHHLRRISSCRCLSMMLLMCSNTDSPFARRTRRPYESHLTLRRITLHARSLKGTSVIDISALSFSSLPSSQKLLNPTSALPHMLSRPRKGECLLNTYPSRRLGHM